MFATDTEVVRPAESRMVIGTPGNPMQDPVGVTVKPAPLEVTMSGRTISVEIVFAMKYGGDPPKTKKTALRSVPAHSPCLRPWKVIDAGVAKKPGLVPVAWEMTKLVRWKEPVETSVTCSNAVWFAAPAGTRIRADARPDWSVGTVTDVASVSIGAP